MNTRTNLLKLILAALFACALAFSLAVRAAATDGDPEQVGDLRITRTAPRGGMVGQMVWVVVEIENVGAAEVVFFFLEKLGEADFDRAQAKSVAIYDPGPGTAMPETVPGDFKLWYYEWHVRLQPGQKTSLAYWLILTRPGMYVISPARISMNGQVYKTASWDIAVGCLADGNCQAGGGESALTCPEDCASGNADSLCDGKLDGLFDPDCEPGYDPDEAIAIQGLPTPTPAKTGGLPWICPGSGALLLFPLGFLVLRVTRSGWKMQRRR